MNSLTKILEGFLKKYIEWGEISKDIDIDDLLSCLDMEEASCNENVNCAFQGDSCRIILPEYNLMYDQDDKIPNKKIYYKKLADEILRYKKIREYVLRNDTFMNYESVDYKINDNEIVTLSTMLYQMYNGEEDENLSKYLKNNSIYDNTNISDGDVIRYKNMIILDDFEEPAAEESVEEESVEEESVEEDNGAIEQKVASNPKPREKKPKEKKPKEKKPKEKNVDTIKKLKTPGKT